MNMNKITLWCKICTSGYNSRLPLISNVTIFKRFASFDINNKKSQNDFENEPERVVKVAVIGVPNAGKSTFINSLIDRKVCAASNKVHTTRGVAKGICTEGNTQIIFLDTPGLVTRKEKNRYQLEESFVNSFKSCMEAADSVCVVQDASNSWTRDKINIKVRKLLERFPEVPSVLVLNKIDLLKSKRVLLDLTHTLTGGRLSNKHFKEIQSGDKFEPEFIDDSEEEPKGRQKLNWTNFTNVFMVSSIEQTGLEDLKKYLVAIARPCPWPYSPVQHSDLPNEELITQAVRAKLLDFMPQEIPYRLKTEMEYYDEAENGSITASILVTCPSPRVQKLLEGASGGKLKQITTHVTADLRNAFYQPINVIITARSPVKET